MDLILVFTIVGGLTIFFFLTLFLGIAAPQIYSFIRPRKAEQRSSFIQLLILGVGGILGIGSFLIAWMTLYQGQAGTQQTLANTKEVEEQRAEATLVESYLQQMGTLMITNRLRTTTDEDVKTVARAQTLSVLRGTNDRNRKRLIFRFLYDSDLINKDDVRVRLEDANFNDAGLYYLNIRNANLSYALLMEASIIHTDLTNTDLSNSRLDGATLWYASFKNANLEDANLYGADLRTADLSEATGLTQPQIEQTIGDQTTQLPGDLDPPKKWSAPVDEQQRQIDQEAS